jgi:hypothetical protein
MAGSSTINGGDGVLHLSPPPNPSLRSGEGTLETCGVHITRLFRADAALHRFVWCSLESAPLEAGRPPATRKDGSRLKTAGLSTGWLLVATVNFTTCDTVQQLCSFAGIVPRQRQSGTSLNKRPNVGYAPHPRLRHALVIASMSALQHNPPGFVLYNVKDWSVTFW